MAPQPFSLQLWQPLQLVLISWTGTGRAVSEYGIVQGVVIRTVFWTEEKKKKGGGSDFFTLFLTFTSSISEIVIDWLQV